MTALDLARNAVTLSEQRERYDFKIADAVAKRSRVTPEVMAQWVAERGEVSRKLRATAKKLVKTLEIES